ncbi:MAG: hypothetical protein K6G50_11660 [bacterium]|nr:hypothetical protein [bacterium]
MSIIGNLTSKISSAVSKAVDAVTTPKTGNSGGASVNTTDRATVSKGYSAGSTVVASLEDESGTSVASGAASGGLTSEVGTRSSASARETTAADENVSDDVKEIAGRMMGSDGVDNPQLKDADGNVTMTLDDITVLAASGGNDEIHVSNGANGGIVVSVNGEEYAYTEQEAATLIIDAGSGNDNVTVDDNVTLALNITGGAGNDNLRGGSGDDIIVDNLDSNNINGGDGEDILVANGNSSLSMQERLAAFRSGDRNALNDPVNVIEGGAGADYIEGGRGNDIIDGGDGNDYIYGLDGRDTISGGKGDDYIDGGRGNDTIDGGKGDDKLFGGRGNDVISGGKGNDIIAGGKGNDVVDGGKGADQIIVYSDGGEDNADVVSSDRKDTTTEVAYMDVPENISVEGDAAFKARVESDLETLAAIAPGQATLNALGTDGHNLVIRETYGGNYEQNDAQGGYISYDENNHATLGSGTDAHVAYNTARHDLHNGEDWSERAPIVALVHEMGHAYDAALGQMDPAYYDMETHEHLYNPDGTYATGSGYGHEKGLEFQTVGGMGYSDLQNDGVERNEHPQGFTENAMRQFFGYALRDTYASTPNYDRPVDTDKL